MSNTVKISCEINTTDVATPLGLEVWVNDHKFYDTDHVQEQQLSIEISDEDGEHELRFVMKNKGPQHTQIDSNGNIVKDVRLTVANLTFDEIPLGYMVTELATYVHDFNGTKELIQDKFYGEMGCNGTVSLKFTTPIYLWLLEHM